MQNIFKFNILLIIASRILHGIQLLVGLTEGVAAIVTSSFCCRVVCCGRKHYPGSVIFSSPENPAAAGATSGVEFSTIPLNSVAQSVVTSAASNYGELQRGELRDFLSDS